MKKAPLLIVIILGIVFIEWFSAKKSARKDESPDFFADNEWMEVFMLEPYYYAEPEPDSYDMRPYGIPEEDQKLFNECSAEMRPYDSLRYNYFIRLVYEPAMNNPKVSYNNKQLLNRIKGYLECNDSCGVDEEPVLPVYRMNYLEGNDYVSIFTRFFYNVDENEEVMADTVLHHGLMQKKMYVYYSNHANMSQHKVKFYDDFKGDCELFRTFILYETDSNDQRKPEFALPFAIDLKPVQDTVFDQLINKNIACINHGRYCDPLGELYTWAQLANVPGLYFVTDKPDDWQEFWFPSRSIYLNIDNKFALELFRFEVELVECSCI